MDPDAQAPELLDALFELGCDLLLGNLDAVWAGLAGEAAAQPQVRGLPGESERGQWGGRPAREFNCSAFSRTL